MLEEAIAKIRSGEAEGLPGDDGQWSPQINLGVPVLIPEAYVPDLDVRLGLYRRLSQLESKVDLEGFAAELIDRFGKLPREVNTLLLVVRIKTMCKRAHIAKLDAGPKGATIQFHNDKFPNPKGLVEFVQDAERAGEGARQQDRRASRLGGEADKIKGAFAIARDLAQHAKGLKTRGRHWPGGRFCGKGSPKARVHHGVGAMSRYQ
jgi:transcription-repair coupling factor (superfamily II helicase)